MVYSSFSHLARSAALHRALQNGKFFGRGVPFFPHKIVNCSAYTACVLHILTSLSSNGKATTSVSDTTYGDKCTIELLRAQDTELKAAAESALVLLWQIYQHQLLERL